MNELQFSSIVNLFEVAEFHEDVFVFPFFLRFSHRLVVVEVEQLVKLSFEGMPHHVRLSIQHIGSVLNGLLDVLDVPVEDLGFVDQVFDLDLINSPLEDEFKACFRSLLVSLVNKIQTTV